MKVLDDMIMLQVDWEQKESVTINGYKFLIVPNRKGYNEDGKQTNPVIGKVHMAGKRTPFIKGDYILMQHNSLPNTAMQVGGYVVVPNDRWILATITNKGELKPTKDHLICERIEMPHDIDGFILPESAFKKYDNQVRVLAGSGFDEGETIGILKYADYEVIYNWKGEQRRRIVVWKKDVICKL
jgi:hypothetical protein